MTIYQCNLCFKEFRQKCHLDDHLYKKKKPCIAADIQNIQPAQNCTKTAQNGTSTAQILHKTAQNGTKLHKLEETNINDNLLMHNALQDFINNKHSISNIIDESNVRCEHCNKEFLRKDSLTRHLKKFCKYKKQNDDKDLIIKTLIEEVSELKKLIKNDIYNNTTNTNTNTNSNNTMNNSNNKTNNINQNIQVNISGFGKEDLEKLDIKEAMNVYLKSTGGNIVPNMLNYINHNKNYPQNHNICITDLSREIVKMHNGEKYVYKKFKNAKFDIVDKIADNISGIVGIYKKGNYKKSEEINKKININNTSLKLISGEELIESESELDDEPEKEDFKSINDEDIINDLNNMDENIQKIINNNKKIKEKEIQKININQLNSKMEGLQKLTFDKLKDELYNNRELIEQMEK